MANKLEVLYPGKTVVDANNQFGTFKNRINDILKDGTPFERGWASDVWGFLAHILKKAGVIPNSNEENETNSQYYDALDGLIGRIAVDVEAKNLKLTIQSNTIIDADADSLTTLDSNNKPTLLLGVDLTFDSAADIVGGEAVKNDHWYDLYTDSAGVEKLAPVEEGTNGTAAAGFLVDAALTLATDLFKQGDIVKNTTAPN